MMSVLLKKPLFEHITNRELVEQIEAKKKSAKKLPTWFNANNIYYPKKINIEQTSSEITARYKSEYIAGKSLLDITGGFGIDSYFFSKKIDTTLHCEIDKKLSEIVRHNYQILGVKNINTICADGIVYLKENNQLYDWIYVDPSRRSNIKGKVFQLSDCLPNIGRHLNLLFKRSKKILIKTSPLLDISKGISELKNVAALHIVAVNNEVKELLWFDRKYQENCSGTI